MATRDLSSNERVTQKINLNSVENPNTKLDPSDREDNSWPELPNKICSKNTREKLKFSHVVRQDGWKGTKSTDRAWEQPRNSEQAEKECISDNKASVTDGKDMKSQGKWIHEHSEAVEPTQKGPFWRSKALKAEKKRAREEEARKNLLAPKGQRVRIVNQKVLEAVLNNSVSFVNQYNTIPTFNKTDFPTVEEARKQRIKLSESKTDEQSGTLSVPSSRIKKRKDPIRIDLISLIKHKPRRAESDAGRVQKRASNTPRYSGNQLDASKPERKRGKVKEVPKRKKLGVLKSAILEERALRQRLRAITGPLNSLSIGDENKPVQLTIHSRKFREYCDNFVTRRLNEAVKLLLKDIVKFQDRQHWKDPVKAFAKRRYVSGFREVKKQLHLKKVKLVVIAPDLEVAKTKGGIDDIVAELKADTDEFGAMYLFALSRRELGYLTFKKVGISCIGICNYEGSENNHQEVLAALAESRACYQSEISSKIKNTPDATGQMIASLLSKLSVHESPFLTAIEDRLSLEKSQCGECVNQNG